jgi:hypothetical protein
LICALLGIELRLLLTMADTNLLPCDGCGQFAPPAHIARRLQRLEWASRYRPVHVQSVLLGAVVPAQQGAYLYAESEQFSGEAGQLLRAVEISTEGKSRENALLEFQKRGLVLLHMLECPLEGRLSPSEIQGLLERQTGATLARIRRSLKPKRVLLFSKEMAGMIGRITETELEIPVLLNDGNPFELNENSAAGGTAAWRSALATEFTLEKK